MANVLNHPEYQRILNAASEGWMTRSEALAATERLEAKLDMLNALDLALCVLEASHTPGADYAAKVVRSALLKARGKVEG